MNETEPRWQQRFRNFQKALAQLDSAVNLSAERDLSNLEKQGLIQTFEFSYELAWNCLREYLTWQGIEDIVGSRDTIREAFSRGLVKDGSAWMGMLLDRNRTSHTYNEQVAAQILKNITEQHIHQLRDMRAVLQKRHAD